MGLFKGKAATNATPATAKAPAKGPAKAPAAPKAQAAAKAEKKPKAEKLDKGSYAEELADAIAGRLKPREQKGSKNQESLTAETESGRPKGRPLGVTTGLPILLGWCYIFQQNEKAPKEQRLTDEEISNWMKKEYPGRDTPAFDHPARARREYNEGKFTRGTAPVKPSRPYDKDGNVLTEKPKGENEASKVTKGKAVAEKQPRKKVFAVAD